MEPQTTTATGPTTGTATGDLPTLEQVCSPLSSKGGAESYNYEGTPETRITAFSPEDHSARSTKYMTGSNNLAASDPQPTRFTTNATNTFAQYGNSPKHDPFITTTEQSAVPKLGRELSATAADFQPFGRTDGLGAALNDTLAHDSTQNRAERSNLNGFTGCNTSTDLGLSRVLLVTSTDYPQTVGEAVVRSYITTLGEQGMVCHGTTSVFEVQGGVFIRFTNVRDACMLAHKTPLDHDQKWKTEFKSPVLFHEMTSQHLPSPSGYEGQLMVLAAQQRASGMIMDVSRAEGSIRQTFQLEGDMFAFKTEATFRDGLKLIVEYSDVNLALDVADKLQGTVINGLKLEISHYAPDQTTMNRDAQIPLATPTATPMRPSFDDATAAFQAMSLTEPTPGSMFATPGSATPMSSAYQVASPYGIYPMMYRNQMAPASPYLFDPSTPRPQNVLPQTPMAGAMTLMRPMFAPSPSVSPMHMHQNFMSPRSMNTFHRPDQRRSNAMRVNRAPFFNAAGHHNHVDTVRIREGIDVRTTVMLRNIPNKVDQMMLKKIVDESSWGKYDFMYLRIDFANDCNVGYAFINFVDPLDIIDFVNARGNQRWNCFKSDKVAEISYATIQGKDCLVQKFRNSSVMLEAAHYRPKLFYTSNGPAPDMAGQEEPFPPPDNHSKMKRSVENAEHVGLFTPNAGQHFRDEQRRRRSQYDRGTRLAALEEFDLGGPSSLQYLPMPQQ